MKFLFKMLIGFLLFIGLILFSFYKSASVPVKDYENMPTNITIMDMVNEQIDVVLEDNTKPLVLGVTEKKANQLIRLNLVNGLKGNSTDLEYISKSSLYGFQGAWTTITDDRVVIEAGVHLFLGPVTYKTRILLTFDITEENGVVVLVLNKFNIGKIPMAWMSGVASSIYKLIMKEDINHMINNALGGIGTFDLKERKLVVDLQQVVESSVKNPEQKETLEAVLGILYKHELVDLKASEDIIGVNLNLNKLAASLEDLNNLGSLSTINRITTQQELELLFASKVPGAFTSILVDDKAKISFNELDTNRLIDYLAREAANKTDDLTGLLIKQQILEGYSLEAYTPYVTINNNSLKLDIALNIVKNDTNEMFKMIISISETNLLIQGKDLKISFETLDMGEIEIENTELYKLISSVAGDLFTEEGIVIKDFTDKFNQEDLKIENITISNYNLVFTVDMGNIISKEDILNGLEDILDNPAIPEEIKDAAENIINGTGLTQEEAINELNNLLNDPTMDQSTIDEITNALNNYLN